MSAPKLPDYSRAPASVCYSAPSSL